MKAIRLAGKILSTLVKDRVRYPGRLFADTTAMVARCGVLLILYWYVFNLKNGAVNGVPYAVVAWSIYLYFVLSTLRLRDISRAIARDVRSGNVDVLLNRPISYVAYRVWWQIGSGLYSFLVAVILGTTALALAVGFPATMSFGWFAPTLLLAFVGCVALSLGIYVAVGLLAFWIEDIDPVFWITDKAVMMLGGSYLPVAFFPPLMSKIALWSPFGASQFVTRSIYGSWQVDWLGLLGIQLVWIAFFSLVVSLVYARARKTVSVNGG